MLHLNKYIVITLIRYMAIFKAAALNQLIIKIFESFLFTRGKQKSTITRRGRGRRISREGMPLWHQLSGPCLDKICTFQVRSLRFRIIKEREQRFERRDRNTEQRRKGHPMNTILPVLIFHMLIFFTPKWEWGGNRLH